VFPTMIATHMKTRQAQSGLRGVRACVRTEVRVGAALGPDLTRHGVNNSGTVIRETRAVLACVGPEVEGGAVGLAPLGRRHLLRVVTHPQKASCEECRENTDLPGGVRGVVDHPHVAPSFNPTFAPLYRRP
jgi:hypothetical protein